MSFLKFNKAELVNLSYSLRREIILSNRTGAYCNTSIIGCNTRRYHGLLAVPVESLGGGKHMLLSSVDESLTMRGHRFNLGIHCYDGMYEPKGHKYVVDFCADPHPEITVKVGEIVFKKSFLMAPDADQVMIKYTLVSAPEKVELSLKPLLAFRNIHSLTKKNEEASTSYTNIEGGVCFNMYKGYPDLNMQISAAGAEFKYSPCWYMGVTYTDEYRRGFECKEDLFSPGDFSIAMKAGDSIVFSAATSPVNAKGLKTRFATAAKKLPEIDNFQDLLVRNAQLLKCNNRITAGFSWLETGLLRETLMALPGLTLYADGDCDEFEKILDNLISAEQERLYRRTTQVEAPLRLADVLEQYIDFAGDEQAVWKKYGKVLKGVIESYSPGIRKEVSLHPNGLLWAQMDGVALSWMNAYINGNPVTERAGYQVDTNAWWYNALGFAIDMEMKYGKDASFVEKWAPVRDLAKVSFCNMFWNSSLRYLADYVDNNGAHEEVRPNMMIAAYVKYSPVDDVMRKYIMRTVTNELITRRGVRTLSPRNINYRGIYEGSQIDRDLAYHNGCTRTELLGEYVDIMYKMSGPAYEKKAEYLLEGFLEDASKHGVGAFSELYDGDPPHEPHGAISSACATAALLRCEYLIALNKEVVK